MKRVSIIERLKPQALRRTLERAAFRLFGARGLGVAVSLLRMGRSFHRRGNPTVLVLTHNLFAKDIAEIDRLGRLNLLTLPMPEFSAVQKWILPREICTQRFYFASLGHARYRDGWRASEELAASLLAVARLRGRIDAVLSAHVDYWQDEGLRRVCARLGIPFLVLCQENYNIPKTFRAREEQYCELGFRFGGTAVATFSPHMRDFFVRTGICSADRVAVTGAPRLDGWQRLSNAPGRRIVLLSFLDPNKYYASADFFFSILDAMCRAVGGANDEWELVVKCKYRKDTAQVLQRVGNARRVRVGYDMSMPELLSTASIVVGGNSLSMLEGLLSQAELFVTAADLQQADAESLMFDPRDELVGKCMNFAQSAQALEAAVHERMRAPLRSADHAARLALLKRYIHYVETEPSSQRVVEFIEAYADKKAARPIAWPPEGVWSKPNAKPDIG